VNIRFTSSLTPEDENAIAPALLKAVIGILDLLPIAYSIRIDTSDAQVYQHSGVASESAVAPRARHETAAIAFIK
jgi:hypothetical protein